MQLERRGRSPPGGACPDLAPGLDVIYAAFSELQTCRVFGGPIPWTAIQKYAEAHGMDRASRDELHALVRALDIEYLKHQDSKRSQG